MVIVGGRTPSKSTVSPGESDVKPCGAGGCAVQTRNIPAIRRFYPYSDFASCRQFAPDRSSYIAAIRANPTFDRAMILQKINDFAEGRRKIRGAPTVFTGSPFKDEAVQKTHVRLVQSAKIPENRFFSASQGMPLDDRV